ncbi:MAG: rhombosortase [Gammaproteobacteria bacterium]|nr:rhombosortase [Gammaproteobacteria bacterium]
MSLRQALPPALYRAWPLGLVVAVCVGLAFGGEPLRLALRYERALVASGEWWRLFTGNFVHTGWMHVGLDMAGLILLWLLTFRQLRGWRWLAATVIGSWVVGLGLWWVWPNVVWYVGISGVAHTYWAAGAILLILAREWEGWPLLILLAGKLTWERVLGPLPSSAGLMNEPVLTVAHLAGAVGGVACIPLLLAPRLLVRLRRPPRLQ